MSDLSDLLTGMKSKTVIGINPPVFDFAWFDLWSKPLGLLYILEFLRSGGNDVHLIDSLYEARTGRLPFGRWKVRRELMRKPEVYAHIPRRYWRFGLSPSELAARLSALPEPDFILVTSAMTYWYPGVFEAIETARRIFPRAVILLGGAYAILCPGHAAKSGADFVQSAPLVSSAFPLPARPAVDLYREGIGYGVVMSSFGCPMSCRYCASKKLFPTFARRPLGDVIEDVRFQLSASGAGDKNIAFYDDALLLEKRERFYPLCEAIAREFPGTALHTPNGLHVSQIDGECAETLYRAGFHTLRLSLEGTDSFTGAAGGGKVGEPEYERAVSALKSAGYPDERLETYILVGLPGQRAEDIFRSVDYVKSLGGRPKITEYSPIPGTPMYSLALESCPQLADEPLLHNNTAFAPWISGSLPPNVLQELKSRARGE